MKKYKTLARVEKDDTVTLDHYGNADDDEGVWNVVIYWSAMPNDHIEAGDGWFLVEVEM